MSIYNCFFVLLFASAIFTYANSQDPIQRYVIHKDFFIGIKAGEFTIYDTSEKNVYYRIESNYGILQDVEVIVYPSKQVIGLLQSKIKFLFLYEAEISTLDSQSNQWLNGTIEKKFQLLGKSFNIDWNGHRITMASEPLAFTSKIHDTNGQLLAQFRIRPASIFWAKKYDMQIFSNKYPEQLYLLGLFAYDRSISLKKNG
jgi:hypothetical protein